MRGEAGVFRGMGAGAKELFGEFVRRLAIAREVA